MSTKPITNRLDVVKYYMTNKTSLRKTAEIYKVSYRTLHKWVKWYKEDGEKRLLATYRKPWNRFDDESEKLVIMLKERNPGMTLRNAQQTLREQGVRISLKGIWSVWRRFGFAGADKKNLGDHFSQSRENDREVKAKLDQATALFKTGKVDDATEILNSVPFLPPNDLLVQIPDDKLNLRRRAEKIVALFGRMPLHQYLQEIGQLRAALKKAKLYYSTLLIGTVEILAMARTHEPRRQLKKIRELTAMIEQNRQCSSYLLFELRFTLLVSEASAYIDLSDYARARAIAQKCRRMLVQRKHPPRQSMEDLAALYSYFYEFRKAEAQHKKLLRRTKDKAGRRDLMTGLRAILFAAGKYKELSRLLKPEYISEDWSQRAAFSVFRGLISLMRGEPQKALEQSSEALMLSRKDELARNIYSAYLTIACAQSSLGRKNQSSLVLKRLVHFLKKKGLRRYVNEIKLLLDAGAAQGISSQDPNVSNLVKLRLFFIKRKYDQAYRFARYKGILLAFYRNAFFFPDIVNERLHAGKPTYLPRAVLMLPAFNEKAPVYFVKILGQCAVFKDKIRMNAELKPKDMVFLIHLAIRANTPGKKVALDQLYQNFWPKANQPARNLAHALVRIKKALRLPTHLLNVSRQDPASVVNKGVFFTTDYQNFEQVIVQAQSLKRADAWDLAKKEYLRAFDYWRGEPFGKMYDNWSEDYRTAVLNKLDREISEFCDECKIRQESVYIQRVKKMEDRILGRLPPVKG